MYFGEPDEEISIAAQDPLANRSDVQDEFGGGIATNRPATSVGDLLTKPNIPQRPDSNVFDIFRNADRAYQSLDAINARQLASEAFIDKKNERIKSILGIDLENPHRTKGLVSQEQARRGEKGDSWTFYQKRLRELAEKYPEHKEWLKPDTEQRAEGYLYGREAEQNLARSLADYDHWTGDLAAFAGGMYGMRRDPLNLSASLLGFSKAPLGFYGLLWGAAKNAGLNAAIEAAQQPTVQAYRKAAGVESGFDVAALNVGMAALFGGGIDLAGRGIYRGANVAMGREAQLDIKGNVEGYVPKGKAVDPALIERVKQGDIEATKQVAKDLGVDQDPEFKRGIEAAEANARAEAEIAERVKIPGVDDGEHLGMLAQAMRAGSDELEPPPRAPDPASREVATLRTELEVAGERELLDRMPDTKASVREWEKFQTEVENENLKGVIARHIEGIKALQGKVRDLEARINAQETSPVEVARIFKDEPAMVAQVMPSPLKRLQAARDLSRLPDEVLADVESGQLSPQIGALVGNLVDDTTRHASIAKAVREAGAETPEDIRRVIGDELQRGTEYTTHAAMLGVREGTDLTPPRKVDDPAGPEAQAHIRELTEKLGNGRTIDDAVDAFAEAVEKIQHMLPKGTRIAAHFDASKPMGSFADDLIEISLLAIDPERYLRHEAVHALKKAGMFSDTEWRMLVDLAEREGVLQVREHGPDGPTFEERYREAYDGYQNIDDLLKEEAVVNLIERHLAGKRYGNDADTILARVAEFLRNLAKALNVRGFDTVDDVIERLMSGEIAKRPSPGKAAGEEVMLALSNFDRDPITPGLDMSQAARLQRAREMGFDTETVYYHGSPDFREVKKAGGFDARTRSAENMGDPVEVKRLQDEMDAERAANGTSNRYFELLNEAAALRQYETIPQATYFTDNKGIAKTYTNEHRAFDFQNAESDLIDVYARGNLLDVSARGKKFSDVSIDAVRTQLPENLRSTFDDIVQRFADPSNTGKIRTGDMEVIASKLGFDGFRLRQVRDAYDGSGPPVAVVAVFDPSNIRSVNAAFDPANASSSNLLASLRGNVQRDTVLYRAESDAALAQEEARKAADDGMLAAIRAFHGSAHDFDRFDMRMFKSGEGKILSGYDGGPYGMWFARDQKVGEGYALDISRYHPELIKNTALSGGWSKNEVDLANQSIEWMKNEGTGDKFNHPMVEFARDFGVADKRAMELAEDLENNAKKIGVLYEVDLNIDEKYLWKGYTDLNSQTLEVQKIVKSLIPDVLDLQKKRHANLERYIDDPSVNVDLLLFGNEAAAKRSSEAGIQGVDYGQTINVIDLDRIKITKKNGKPVSKGERGQMMFAIKPSLSQAESFIEDNNGGGFTRFPITEKLRQSVMDEGQPLFAMSRNEPEPASKQAFEASMAQTKRMGALRELVEACRG